MPMVVRMLAERELALLWTIDRREYIANIYRLHGDELVVEPHHFDVPGWQAGQEAATTPRLHEALGRGGEAWAVFDGDTLVGAAVIDPQRAGVGRDLVKLEWLHVSRDYRGKGLGSLLFEKARQAARQRGAAGLYISATPSQNTVDFYRSRGAALVTTPDPELLALEPDDIHLEWRS